MTEKNEIIVLIPHYNDLDGLVESLASIREEINVDVLVVDDGSKEPPQEEDLRASYAMGRINLLKLEQNQGIEHALNAGLKQIMKLGYTYVARLDCGDTCLPDRFALQLDYLKSNLNVMLLGSQVNYVDGDGNFMYTSRFPLTYKAIKKWMYVNCMLAHPSVILRSEILDEVGLYPTKYPAAEDYGLFLKIVKMSEVRNLKEVLLTKVIDDKSISSVKRKTQIRSKLSIIWDNFYFGIYPIYGLIRNSILYFFPRKIVSKVKSKITRS